MKRVDDAAVGEEITLYHFLLKREHTIDTSVKDNSNRGGIADSIDKIVKAHYQNLISPTGMVTGKFIGIDPLNLTSTNIKKLQGLQLDENIEIYEGYFLSKDHKNLLAFLSPAFKSSDNKKSELLINYLEVIRKSISNISKGKVELEYYGGPAVTVSNSACMSNLPKRPENGSGPDHSGKDNTSIEMGSERNTFGINWELPKKESSKNESNIDLLPRRDATISHRNSAGLMVSGPVFSGASR